MMSPPNLLESEAKPVVSQATHKELTHAGKGWEATAFLFLLLGADFLFMLIHCIHAYTSFLNNDVFSISKDHSYAEVFTYVKECWVIGLLLVLGVKFRKIVFPVWAGFFSYILIDDAFMMHERIGSKISTMMEFSPMFYLRPIDFGELIITGFMGTSFLIGSWLISKRGGSRSRKVTFDLSLLLVLLAGFGVGVDMLHVVIKTFMDDSLIMILEDGGEMVTISFICWYLFTSLSFIQKRNNLPYTSPLAGTYKTLIDRFNLPKSYHKYLK